MSAPTATVAAVGLAARRGILVKGGQFLEEAARADVVLFDKTGTLTHGRPVVDTVAPAPGQSAAEVLALAAAVERDAAHPLAVAIREAACRQALAVPAAETLATALGLGVRGQVGSRTVEVGSPAMCGGEDALPGALLPALAAIRESGATAWPAPRRDGARAARGFGYGARNRRPSRGPAARPGRGHGRHPVRRSCPGRGGHGRTGRPSGKSGPGSSRPTARRVVRLSETRPQGAFRRDGVNDAPGRPGPMSAWPWAPSAPRWPWKRPTWP
jgi:hypothetical protein